MSPYAQVLNNGLDTAIRMSVKHEQFYYSPPLSKKDVDTVFKNHVDNWEIQPSGREIGQGRFHGGVTCA